MLSPNSESAPSSSSNTGPVWHLFGLSSRTCGRESEPAPCRRGTKRIMHVSRIDSGVPMHAHANFRKRGHTILSLRCISMPVASRVRPSMHVSSPGELWFLQRSMATDWLHSYGRATMRISQSGLGRTRLKAEPKPLGSRTLAFYGMSDAGDFQRTSVRASPTTEGRRLPPAAQFDSIRRVCKPRPAQNQGLTTPHTCCRRRHVIWTTVPTVATYARHGHFLDQGLAAARSDRCTSRRLAGTPAGLPFPGEHRCQDPFPS